MEILPILQALSTPVLMAFGWLGWRGTNALHKIDKRLTIVEYELREHRKTEETNYDEEN